MTKFVYFCQIIYKATKYQQYLYTNYEKIPTSVHYHGASAVGVGF